MEPPSKAATTRARPGQDWPTISASGGQAGGQGKAQFERHFQYSHDLFIESVRNCPFLRGRRPRAAVVWALPINPHGTGVFRVLNNKGKRGCEPGDPLSPGGDRAARGGRKWRERSPLLALVRHERGVGWTCLWPPYPLPQRRGSLPPQLSLRGRLSSRPGSRPRKTADHRWPSGRERQAWGMHTTGYLRSAARAACHPARRSRTKRLGG